MSMSRWVIGDSGGASRPLEQPVEGGRGHLQAFAILEVGHVHPKRPVRFEVDQMVADTVDVDRPPVGGQSHQLVFAGVDSEPRVVGEGGVEQSQRVRKPQLV